MTLTPADALTDLLAAFTTLDELVPAERLRALCHTTRRAGAASDALRVCEIALLALMVIDAATRELQRHRTPLYVQGDASLHYALGEIASFEDGCQLREAILMLAQSQLIYRFNAAVKFELSATKQLRINSWGYRYVRDNALEAKYRAELALVRGRVQRQIADNRERFAELMRLLSREIDPAIARAIRIANEPLSIRLLC